MNQRWDGHIGIKAKATATLAMMKCKSWGRWKMKQLVETSATFMATIPINSPPAIKYPIVCFLFFMQKSEAMDRTVPIGSYCISCLDETQIRGGAHIFCCCYLFWYHDLLLCQQESYKVGLERRFIVKVVILVIMIDANKVKWTNVFPLTPA